MAAIKRHGHISWAIMIAEGARVSTYRSRHIYPWDIQSFVYALEREPAPFQPGNL